MTLFFNMTLAWGSVILTILLSGLFIFKMGVRKRKTTMHPSKKIHLFLKKHHKFMGILLVMTGFIHGFLSSENIWSFNLGTIAWIISIILGINWMMRKYLFQKGTWLYYHRFLTVLFIVMIVWHVYDVGGINIHKVLFSENRDDSSRNLSDVEKNDVLGNLPMGNQEIGNQEMGNQEMGKTEMGNQYRDGVFEGEAVGFRPGLKVKIEIRENKIVSIKVIEHNEINSRYYSKPIELIPQEIIKTQRTDVDTISGATFTSIGIGNAVNNALGKALISGEIKVDKKLPQGQSRRGHF